MYLSYMYFHIRRNLHRSFHFTKCNLELSSHAILVAYFCLLVKGNFRNYYFWPKFSLTCTESVVRGVFFQYSSPLTTL